MMAGRELPGVDPITGCPSALKTLVVNQDPYIKVVPNFLSDVECEHFLNLAEGYWTRSLVGKLEYNGPEPAPDDKPKPTESRSRTSCSCIVRAGQTAVVQRIEKRMANLAGLPVEHLERLAMVRYSPGEYFNEHHDGKFRPRTIFVYLNDLPEGDGGDTFFPHLGLSFVPRAGCAVMWSNATPEGNEDSRMVHAGRPPKTAVKFGINCFLNEGVVRLVQEPAISLSVEEAYTVDVRALSAARSDKDEDSAQEGDLRTFVLKSEPQVTAVPRLASEDDVAHLLGLLDNTERRKDPFFIGSTVLLQSLGPAQDETVRRLEERLADVAQLPVERLGQMRIVRCATTQGLCNRGNGQRSAIVCLSEEDEVFFPHLGLRLILRSGDMLLWPNVFLKDRDPITEGPGKLVVEDLRTVRVHLKSEGRPEALALDATFHDGPIRTLQEQLVENIGAV